MNPGMDPLGELTRALTQASTAPDGPVRADVDREDRKGVPEVILADAKTGPYLLVAVRALLDGRGRAIVSRVTPEHRDLLRRELAEATIEEYGLGRTLVVRTPSFAPVEPGGRVGVIAAGTSDVPVAEEAAVVAREMGCEVLSAYDVGVAGIHRLFGPLRAMLERRLDVAITAAGMDGALPSVVAGLVDVPVIGLPVSVGYGFGGQGVAALMSMLQTCAPGLAVVNVDNGVGAGATAGLIARRAAEARGELPPRHRA